MTLGIAGTIAGVTYPRLSTLTSHYRLDGASRRLMANVQKIRFRAVAERQCFKIKFDSPVPAGSYQVQKGPATGGCASATYTDDGAIQNVDSAGLLTVASTANPVFDTRGAVNTTATITLTSPMGGSRSVSVETAGRIRIQ